MARLSTCVALLGLLAFTQAQATQHIIGKPSPGVIRQTIERAQPGDTIRIHKGSYRESPIMIDKPITLIGMDRPTLDGENKVEVLTVTSPHVTITGFTIANSGISSMKDLAGVGADQADHLTIVDNWLQNTFFGIHINASDHCRVENNRLITSMRQEYNTGNGIHLWQCDSVVISNNLIEHHRDGIYLEFVTHTSVIGNTCEDNLRYGLHFMFSHDNEYRRNIFGNNGAGVAVMYTRRVRMIDNEFRDNWGSSAFGLLLKDITDSEITSNRFIRNTVGVFMEGTSRSLFQSNQFTRNGWGIKLQANCDDNVLRQNNFQSNTFDIATNGTVVLNTLEQNYWDKYDGYDLDRDAVGDVPYRPVSIFSSVVERVPTTVLLWRSFLVFLLDRSERVFPAVTPENLKDNSPMMKPYDFSTKR